MKKFFAIVTLPSNAKRMTNKTEALAEAKALAEKNPDRKFTVVQAVTVIDAVKMKAVVHVQELLD